MENMTNEELLSYFLDCVEFPDDGGKNVSGCQKEILTRLHKGQAAIKAMFKVFEALNDWTNGSTFSEMRSLREKKLFDIYNEYQESIKI